jgi:hypothetical protein
MSQQPAKKKPDEANEILELFVQEVSVVDRPANLRDFLVIKRNTKEATMGAFVQDPKVESTELVEKLDWTDLEKAALPDDLKKMIDSAVAWMKKNASADGAPKDEILAAAALLSKVASGKFPGAAPKEKVDDDKDKDKDNKNKDDDKDKKKSLLSVLDDGSLEIGGEPIEKGKSQFTSQRVESLKSALAPLFGIYAQVDVDGAKEMVQALVKDTLSGEVKWTEKRVQDVDLSEQIKKAMQPVLDGLTEIGKRVDSIEKTRPAPQSEPGDGDTTVKKSDNVWDGLPVG